MRAWQFTKAGKRLDRIELADPVPREGEVVIELHASGLCHSDVGFLEGVIEPAFVPIVLGHEAAGIITDLGAGVTDYNLGDRVAVNAMGDGTTANGLDYIGIGRNGAYAEKVSAWPRELVRIPDQVTFDQAAAATDAGMTSYHALMVTGGVRPGMKVGIVGLGGLGSTAAQIAAIAGAEVIGADINPDVRAIAHKLGVTEVVPTAAELEPFAPDVIVDFAGFGTTTAGAIEAVKAGGTVVQVGLGAPEATISTQLVTMKHLTLVGSLGGAPADTAAVVDLIAAGKLRISTELIGFDEIDEGLHRLARGEVHGSRLVAVLS
jgi:alcohol dehydrogenase, propanol-preferring